jgi:hypothetical protein
MQREDKKPDRERESLRAKIRRIGLFTLEN